MFDGIGRTEAALLVIQTSLGIVSQVHVRAVGLRDARQRILLRRILACDVGILL